MKVAFLDSVYPEPVREAYGADPGLASRPWEEQRDRLLEARFGCWTSWADGCQQAGAEAQEIIIGVPELDAAMAAADWPWLEDAFVVVRHPRLNPELAEAIRTRARGTAVMVTSEAPPDEELRRYDLTVTAFPAYYLSMRARGLKVRYLPLAFDPRRRTLFGNAPDGPLNVWEARDLPVTFVGGVGVDRHWPDGTRALDQMALRSADFRWWGYRGPDAIGKRLLSKHMGEAWGDAYFDVLGRSRMTVNRHGTVHTSAARGGGSQWWACNMRMYEATGMGAMLLTEDAVNLRPGGWEGWPEPLFDGHEEVVTYRTPAELPELVAHYQQFPERAEQIARQGRRRCLADHTYARRAPVLLDWLEALAR